MAREVIYVCDWCAAKDPAASDYDDTHPKGWEELDDGLLCAECVACRKDAIAKAVAAARESRKPKAPPAAASS